MKPVLSKVQGQVEGQVSVIERSEPYFTNVFHFHEECELVYVVESKGKRIIGDHIAPFESGDLVFVGANLPHVWHNDPLYFEENSGLHARSIVVYFRQDIFGSAFFQLAETRKLAEFFNKAKRGITLYGKTKEKIEKAMKQLPGKSGLNRIIGLLEILQLFSETKEMGYLAGLGYSNTYQPKDNYKIDHVFRFMLDNYHRNITLREAADVAKLTPQSFCRFFKNRTQKSFIHFLNEIRISQVCKRLTEEDRNISEVAYSCGFSNLSNFNRFFKLYTGRTPSVYAQEIRLENQQI